MRDGRARQVPILLRTETGLKVPDGILENNCAETLQAGALSVLWPSSCAGARSALTAPATRVQTGASR